MHEMDKMGDSITAVFDFDWTIVDDNTDTWIFKCLEPSLLDEMKQLQTTVQWTDLIDHLMGKLHETHKKARPDYEMALQSIAFPKSFCDLFHMLSNSGKLMILSDSNTFFIDTILRHHNCEHYFSEVITNPVTWTPEGKLRIHRLHSKDNPHNCSNSCALNICKGLELRARVPPSSSSIVFYFGDGRNDFCPALSLSQRDHVFAREGFALAKLCRENGEKLSASVHYWKDGDDLLRVVESVLSKYAVN